MNKLSIGSLVIFCSSKPKRHFRKLLGEELIKLRPTAKLDLESGTLGIIIDCYHQTFGYVVWWHKLARSNFVFGDEIKVINE